MMVRHPGRPPLADGVALNALTIFVRLDPGRARVIQELARAGQAENPEIMRRMIDFWIAHHPAEVRETP